MNNVVNIHADRLAEVPEIIARLERETGMEPVICVHIYAFSFDELRGLMQGRGLTPVDPGAHQWFCPPPKESPELTEAREKLANWSKHNTAYAVEQRAFWRKRVDILSKAQNSGDAPPDATQDHEP